MSVMDKRTFLKLIAIGSTAGAMPWLLSKVNADSMKSATMPEGYYSIPNINGSFISTSAFYKHNKNREE